ncbi:hypothetical protein TNCT_242291 [Trichonephila clavata]|uniref:Uncharacterized protein n=1 Tax=Trichonephila clavata TaxID=2740835 RepID=A0A8X6K8S8_TRICU|nr:hypothetical protein TNCT_242291 [Trichonephila clavata]
MEAATIRRQWILPQGGEARMSPRHEDGKQENSSCQRRSRRPTAKESMQLQTAVGLQQKQEQHGGQPDRQSKISSPRKDTLEEQEQTNQGRPARYVKRISKYL